MTFAPRFTITHAVTADLTTIERARGFLEAAKLSDDWLRRMSQRALLLEAHHTTHIEGTQLTLDDAETLGRRVGRVRAAALNDRQARIIERLLEVEVPDIEDLEAIHPGVHRRTLERDLGGLVDKALVTVEGAARATRYSIVIKHS